MTPARFPNYEVLVHNHQRLHWVEPELPRRSALLTLALEKAEPCSLAVVLFDDEQTVELNDRYLDRAETTDVLAFNLDGDDAGRSDSPPLLGDVFVNVEQALRQAADYQLRVEREIAILTAHGVLHLLGYDDADEHGSNEMMARCSLVVDHEWLTAYLGDG
jgi:probable rRNA maturation factor